MMKKIKIAILKKLGKLEEPEVERPPEYIEIDFSEEAKQQGIYTKENLVLNHFINGGLYRSYPYSRALVDAFREKMRIPIADVTQKSNLEPDQVYNPGQLEWFEYRRY